MRLNANRLGCVLIIRTGCAVVKVVELQENATRHGGAMQGAFDAEIDDFRPAPWGWAKGGVG
jgi:hypothetical protein